MPPKAKRCKNCGCTEFQQDLQANAGDIVCVNCGTVQIENPIVSEVSFGESSTGAATVHGAMISKDSARANFNMRNAMESKEQTLQNAKKNISYLARAMKIPEYIQESASGWFKLALVQNFVQGRRSQNVIAACLYVACRHEKTHHLLIDFSLRLQLSVYSLGSTYLKLVRALQIQKLPLADPSLFIQHFAEKLSFGEHTAKVCRDAAKIAHRMSSDWIYEGRRPAGIAGACVLLAARMNNFRRTHAEIVSVARVGEETIQKRLNEFKKTTSGTLSVLDFRNSNDTKDSLPPSFQKNRLIERKLRALLKQREETLKKYKKSARGGRLFDALFVNDPESRPRSVEPKSEPVLRLRTVSRQASVEPEKSRKQRRLERLDAGSDANGAVGSQPESQPESRSEGQSEGQSEGVAEGTTEGTTEGQSESSSETSDEENNENEEVDNDLFDPSDLEELSSDSEPEEPEKTKPEKSGRLGGLETSQRLRPRSFRATSQMDDFSDVRELPLGRRTKTISAETDPLLRSVLAGGDLTEEDLEIALDRILEGQKKRYKSSLYVTPRETSTEPNLEDDINRPRNLVKNNPTTSQILLIVPDDEELDSADDDDEVDTFKLSELEAREKEKIWTALNHDFLIAQEKRRLKIEADELAGNTSGQGKRRRRVKENDMDHVLDDPAVVSAMNKIGEDGKPISASESAKMMLEKKSFSKKINYKHLDDLFEQA